MKLVIAEKPSVAQSIAKVIGATEKKDGYLQGEGFLVSWCVGHLIELAEPQDYDEKYEKWKKDDLPIFPDPYQYRISSETKKQFQILKDLMNRDDVESLVEATDAGREGELIFRLVYHQAGCRKPFERLWISSMEDKAIEDGFAHLKPGSEYDALYEAALCRERADWIVGINATRLFSTLYGQTLNVGRVMTPTLAMLVTREAEIAGFKPEAFYTMQITAGSVPLTSDRMKEKQMAEELIRKVQAAKTGTVTHMDANSKKEKPPLLYDLTSLQRDANKYYGFTAQQTLDYTQSLYEKKLATYPRTDSRYLTDEMEESTANLAERMRQKYGFTKILQMNVKQVINGKKVSDHHAIIPTVNVAGADYSTIPAGEQKILGLITARLLAAIGEPAEITEFHLEVECAGQTFKTTSSMVSKKGWREIQDWILGSSAEEDGADEEKAKDRLIEVLMADHTIFTEGRSINVLDPQVREGKTTPKKHYTENTLLAGMERAGADETPDEAERKGLGTPATRAGIIEKLVRIGFLERKGDKKTKYLIPTHKGTALITVMPEAIQSPSMTAEWEQKLIEVEKKNFDADEFMAEIKDMLRELIRTYEIVKDAEVLMHPVYEPVGKCPACGNDVVEKQKGFFCSNRQCRFALWKDNRFMDSLGKKMTKQIAESLLRDGKASLKKCRSAKTGKNYDTTLVLSTKESGQAEFSLSFDNSQKKNQKRGARE